MKIPHLFIISLITLTFCLAGCRKSPCDQIKSDLEEAEQLMDKRMNEEALKILLDADSRIDESTDIHTRINLCTNFSYIYYNSYRKEEARRYAREAIRLAREADSTRLLPNLLWNLALNVGNVDSVTKILEECRNLSNLYGRHDLANRCRIFLAKFSALRGDMAAARLMLDSVRPAAAINKELRIDLAIEESHIFQLSGKRDSAFMILQQLNPAELSLDGKCTRYTMLGDMARELRKYDIALAYSDSLLICKDSINSIVSSEALSKVEAESTRRITKEQDARRLAWWIGGSTTVIFLILSLFLLRSRQMRARQLALVEQITRLNLRISDLDSQAGEQSQSDIESSIVKKFRLNREYFTSLAAFGTIRRLNMEPNAEDIPRERLKEATDSVIGHFAESCGNLRQFFPSMTADDTLFCALTYAGLSKELCSVILHASDEALRKRKSRIRQKLPQEIFDLFFSK